MDENSHIEIDDLLVKHLLNETGPDENRRVDEWLSASPANRHHFDQIRLIWEKSLLLTGGPGIELREAEDDEQRAWQTFRREIQRPARPTPFLKWQWMAAAALFLPIVLTGLLWWRNSTPPVMQKIASSGDAVRTDTLPDGSVVILNKRSVLAYPQRFNDKERTADLKGEGFFNIAPDREKPFYVRANGIMITVMGTSFNVLTLRDSTVISVETGAVLVSNRHGSIRLNAAESIACGRDDTLFVKHAVTHRLHSYYRPLDFYCNDTPLWQLVDALNEAYGDSIVIGNPAIRNLPITTTFHNEKLPRILDVIGETLAVKIQHTDRLYILK